MRCRRQRRRPTIDNQEQSLLASVPIGRTEYLSELRKAAEKDAIIASIVCLLDELHRARGEIELRMLLLVLIEPPLEINPELPDSRIPGHSNPRSMPPPCGTL